MSIISARRAATPRFMWRERRRHWTDGRIVVIMPDVPGKHFNAEDSIFLRTPKEHEIGRTAIRSVRENMLRDGKPSWYKPESMSKETTSGEG